MNKPEESLHLYITKLNDEYSSLLKILMLEADDIAAGDENKLHKHLALERDTIVLITGLTDTVHTYLDKIEADEDMKNSLAEISKKKNQAQNRISENISSLESAMAGIKEKIQAVKLPKSARRVYYSGNNATIMDIEI